MVAVVADFSITGFAERRACVCPVLYYFRECDSRCHVFVFFFMCERVLVHSSEKKKIMAPKNTECRIASLF